MAELVDVAAGAEFELPAHYGWVGHISPKNYRRPGTKGFAFIYFLPSGMRSTQKVPGAPARHQASFPIALKLFTKTFLIGSINRA